MSGKKYSDVVITTTAPPAKETVMAHKTYSVGTLIYTRSSLIAVLFWMLWADFCLQIMEQVQTIIPLQLKWQGASDRIIGLFGGSLMAIVTVFLTPVIGMQSDRHRGPLGRRRPFLLWLIPPVVISLILLGSSELIGGLIHTTMNFGLSQAQLTTLLIGIFTILFFIFNTYIMQIYQFLFVDVIPQEVMGKFIGLYRAVGAVSLFIFNRYLFGHAQTHTQKIYIGLAMLYSIAFVLLIWKVKEGEYPPPDAETKNRKFINSLKIYFKECFSIPFYLKLYSIGLCFWAAIVPFITFIVFYATDSNKTGYVQSLGISLDAFGKIKGWTCIIPVPFFLVIGPLIDRFHPLRVVIVGLFGICATFFLSFIFVKNEQTLLVFWLTNTAVTAVFLVGYLAMFARLLPQNKYGQFFSANQLFFCAGLMFAPVLCGWLLEVVKNYRYIFLWSGFFALLGLCVAIAVFYHWRRLGGDKNYIPPELLHENSSAVSEMKA